MCRYSFLSSETMFFFTADEFSEGWIFQSCCTVLSSAKKAVHKHHSIPLPSKTTSWYVPVKWNILDPVYLGPNKFERAKTCTDPSFVHTGPAEPCKVERHFDVIRRGQYFWPVWFRFYADSCKHLNQVRFCTVCAVKAWSLVTRLWLK